MKNKRFSKKHVLVAICIGVLILIAIALVMKLTAPKPITDFQACKSAGGKVMESNSEQCAIDGRTFVNTAKSEQNGYVGLSERAALNKAQQENKAARAVERDGESLPVTMDFSQGRLNFYVKNKAVYKVTVEGEE